jgi:hypothetical protein
MAAKRDFSTGKPTSQSTETRNCPECGRLLEREVLPGALWRLAD